MAAEPRQIERDLLVNRLAFIEGMDVMERAYMGLVTELRANRNQLSEARELWSKSVGQMRQLLADNERLTTQLLQDNRSLASMTDRIDAARRETEELRARSRKAESVGHRLIMGLTAALALPTAAVAVIWLIERF